MTKKARKKVGRPATGAGISLNVRLQPDALAALDNWRRWQPDLPTRPAAVRRLLRDQLQMGGLSASEALGAVLAVLDEKDSHGLLLAGIELTRLFEQRNIKFGGAKDFMDAAIKYRRAIQVEGGDE